MNVQQIPDEDTLKRVATKLIEVMRVQDWDITVHSVTGYEMYEESDNCTIEGCSRRDVKLNTADIYLNRESCIDWYETLIHELIHVQATALIHCAENYFGETHEYFRVINEQLTEKQAQIISKLYPLNKLEEDIAVIRKKKKPKTKGRPC